MIPPRACYAPGDAVTVTVSGRRIPGIVCAHDAPDSLVTVKYLARDRGKIGGLFRPGDVYARECATCAALPGAPTLCADCLRVRAIASAARAPTAPVRHKYRAQKTDVGGRTYASKLEASYAERLRYQRDIEGTVVGWLEQVPLHLSCGAKYVVDFLVFEADGNVRAVECKGMETAVYKLKKRMVEQEYPWLPVQVVKRPTKAKKERKR
jgi:hypothetical protein